MIKPCRGPEGLKSISDPYSNFSTANTRADKSCNSIIEKRKGTKIQLIHQKIN